MSPQLAEKLFSMGTDISKKLDKVSKVKHSTQKQKKFRRKIQNAASTNKMENDLHEKTAEESSVHNFTRAASLHSKRIVKNILWNNALLFIVLVLSSSCIKYVFCAIEPEPDNNVFSDDDTFTKAKHRAAETISTADNNRVNGNASKTFTDLSFLHAFIASLSVIVVSELGDKTFFIAAIMAMRHPRLIVFSGAISALALMTILSALFGQLANLIPRVYTYYISTALFAIFGLKMLRDGYYMSPNDAQEELEEVQSDLKKREDEFEKEAGSTLLPDVECGVVTMVDGAASVNGTPTAAAIRKPKSKGSASRISRVLIQAFTMTFLAEWGDRSQLTTIILAAREDVFGVIVGGVLGHSICTGLAVIGGRIIAQRISVRTVTIVGGVVFLLFAFSALFISPNEEEIILDP